MQKDVIMITGANGEMGHGLIKHLAENENKKILALDVLPLDNELKPYVYSFLQGDILDLYLLGRLSFEYQISTIYHLASILSTKAEQNPELAHRINVEGTLNLLQLASEQAKLVGKNVVFMYPSSIAAYGLPSLSMKNQVNKIKEIEYLQPTTMYGCNKLYCEHLGRYYVNYYKQLSADRCTYCVDFRSIRFPGLISAVTVPTGGTSDYGPEMLHHAAQNIPYSCFVRRDTTLPFMVMTDAIKALLQLQAAPREQLSQLIYNVTSFSLTAEDFSKLVQKSFPNAKINFSPDLKRQAIVDSWPSDVDDTKARQDWGWQPDFNLERSFQEYLIPAVKERYSGKN
jgi:nucleoside-diphosphate-sugar epimerase